MSLDRPRRVPEALARGLPDGAAGRLGDLARLLETRGVELGLVSGGDQMRIWERHILDCLRAAAEVRDRDRSSYDLGAGVGLPGLVVAIARPWLTVHLVEVRRRRAAFLELAIERLGIPNASVIQGRIEDLVKPVDVCFARALAPVEVSWRLARPLLRSGGRLVYFAGEGLKTPPSPPDARAVRLVVSPVLESAGPLVIMAR